MWWKLPFLLQFEEGKEGPPRLTILPFNLLRCRRAYNVFVFVVEVLPVPINPTSEEGLSAVGDLIPQPSASVSNFLELLVLDW